MRLATVLVAVQMSWATSALGDIETFLKNETAPKNAELPVQEKKPDSPVCMHDRTSMVEMEFPRERVHFSVKPSEAETINKRFASWLGHCLSRKIIVVPKHKITELNQCQSSIFVPIIESYKSEHFSIGEKKGTITLTVLQFDNGAATLPSKKVTVTATGDSFWGKNKPLLKSLEAAATNLCGRDDLKLKAKIGE